MSSIATKSQLASRDIFSFSNRRFEQRCAGMHKDVCQKWEVVKRTLASHMKWSDPSFASGVFVPLNWFLSGSDTSAVPVALVSGLCETM